MFKHMLNIYELRSRAHDFEILGPYERAVEFFNKVLEMDSRDQFALIHKGISLAKLGKHEEATASFDKGLDISPQNSFALANKAASLAYLGRYKEAVDIYNKTVSIEPNDINLLSDRNAVLKALKKQSEGNGDTQFYKGRASVPGGDPVQRGAERIKFVDLFAPLFADRLLLDESEEKLRANCQDMIDRWEEFTPNASEQQYKVLQSLKNKEPRTVQKVVIARTQQNQSEFSAIAKVILIVFVIYVFIVGLGHVFGESDRSKLTPESQSSAINQCRNWGGQVIYDDNGRYKDCAINGRIQ